MENAIFIGLSRQVALQRQMSLVANNIANINTPGFKAQKILFEEYLSKPKPANEEMSFVLDYGQFNVETQGQLKLTGRPLDVAMEGPGFMMVETPEGTQYTRAGNFGLNAIGEIVTPAGYRVLDNGQKALTIPNDAKEIKISYDGQISTENGAIGQLGIVEFANMQDLDPAGNGMFTTAAAPLPAQNTKAQQNMIEGSNVQGVMEMTDMIEVSRQYQSMQRMLQTEHDRQRSVIQKLTETQS